MSTAAVLKLKHFYCRAALSKDPEYTKALILMGQALLQKERVSEAIEHLERVISKV